MSNNFAKCAHSASPAGREGGGDVSERELSRERSALQSTPITRRLTAHPKKQLFSAPVCKFTIPSKPELSKSESCATLVRPRDCVDEYSTPLSIAKERNIGAKAISMEDLTPTKRVKREKDRAAGRAVRPVLPRMSRPAAAARVARFMAVSAWRRRRDEVRCLRKTLEFQVGCSEKLRLQVRALKALLESDNGKVRLAIREIDRLKELLRDKEQERALLQKEKMALEEDLCVAEDMASEMRIEWQNTRNQLEGMRAAVEVCEHALALERAAAAEARAQRDHAYARLEAQEEELSQYSALLTAAEAGRAEAATRRDLAESALIQATEKLMTEIKAREDGARECASLMARISLHAFEVETLKALVEQLRHELAGANSQLDEARDKLEWWPRRISKLVTATRSWIRHPNSVLEALFWAMLPTRPAWRGA